MTRRDLYGEISDYSDSMGLEKVMKEGWSLSVERGEVDKTAWSGLLHESLLC